MKVFIVCGGVLSPFHFTAGTPFPQAVREPPWLSACGVSRRRAFPAGVSLPSVSFNFALKRRWYPDGPHVAGEKRYKKHVKSTNIMRFLFKFEAKSKLANKITKLTNKVDKFTNKITKLTNKVDKFTNKITKLTSKVDKFTSKSTKFTSKVVKFASNAPKW
ncbi:hypothetical protein [Peribacillus muralis]|uniref:hypothetical protein n=1 Tax=Peribacillus muralis TaxID=264697 RepID=UPI00128F41CA|nr:hypothetical protein [Peribacillus muralis]